MSQVTSQVEVNSEWQVRRDEADNSQHKVNCAEDLGIGLGKPAQAAKPPVMKWRAISVGSVIERKKRPFRSSLVKEYAGSSELHFPKQGGRSKFIEWTYDRQPLGS
jgi:hypothetical protein